MTGLDATLLWPALVALNGAAFLLLIVGESVARLRARRQRRAAAAAVARAAEWAQAVSDGLVPDESDGLEHLIREIEHRGGDRPPAARTRRPDAGRGLECTA